MNVTMYIESRNNTVYKEREKLKVSQKSKSIFTQLVDNHILILSYYHKNKNKY